MTRHPVHFDQRCIERGITSVKPSILRHDIERAIRDKTDLIERVLTDDRDGRVCTIYRIKHLAEGVFYAVVGDDGRCITLLTQEMMRFYKAKKRGDVRVLSEFQRRDLYASLRRDRKFKMRRMV